MKIIIFTNSQRGILCIDHIKNKFNIDNVNIPKEKLEKTYIGNGVVDIYKTKNILKGKLLGNKVFPLITDEIFCDIDSLKDFSKPILSNISKLDKMNKLKKKEIKIRKEIFTLSSVILLSEAKIVLLIILFGLINFRISEDEIFKRI